MKRKMQIAGLTLVIASLAMVFPVTTSDAAGTCFYEKKSRCFPDTGNKSYKNSAWDSGDRNIGLG